MGAAAFFNPALIASPLFDKMWAAMVLGGISDEIGAIANALSSNRGSNITSRQTAAYRQIVYGTQRVGGTIIYRSTTGSHHDQYNMIIVLAGHICQNVESLYLDGRLVYFDSTTYGSSTRNGVTFGGHSDGNDHVAPDGTTYNFGGLVYCEARYGDQLPGDVMSSMTANDPTWAADVTTGRSPWVGGCTYIYLKVEDDAAMFPGDPEIRVTLNGKCDIFDPRTNTTGWTNNWALVMADVLTNSRYGLSAVYGTDVNTAQLIAAANVCEESVPLASGLSEARYLASWKYDTATAPGDALQQLINAAAGRISFIGGEWYIFPALWTGPEFNWNESHLTGRVQAAPFRARRDLCNRMTGTYTAPNWPYNQDGNLYDQNGWYDGTREDTFALQFQPTSFPAYSRDTLHGYGTNVDLVADGGRLLVKDVDLRACLSIAQAQRVAKILYMRNRRQYSGTYPMALQCYQMQPNTTFNFNFRRLAFSRTLEVTGTRFSVQPPPSRGTNKGREVPAFLVEFDVADTGPEDFEWDVTEELTIYDNPAMSQVNSPYTVAPPTAMSLSTVTSTGVNAGIGGNSTNYGVGVTWTAPADAQVVTIEMQAKPHASTTWEDADSASASSTVATIYGVDQGSAYDVRIRSVRANGGFSVWVEVDNYTV